VETRDGGLSLVLLWHLDEAESLGHAAVPVRDDPGCFNAPELLEFLSQFLFAGFARQVTYMYIQIAPFYGSQPV